jgi:hypothetical protein
MEILPLEGNGYDRSRLEAQQRAAGLQPGDVSRFWQSILIHPLTGQNALVVQNEEDKEFFTQSEIDSLLSQEDAEAADWFLDFEEA